jgi:hypothetical protein
VKFFVLTALTVDQLVSANRLGAASENLKTWLASWHAVFISNPKFQVNLARPVCIEAGLFPESSGRMHFFARYEKDLPSFTFIDFRRAAPVHEAGQAGLRSKAVEGYRTPRRFAPDSDLH